MSTDKENDLFRMFVLKKEKKGTTANEGLANVDASSFFFFALLGGRRGTMCLNLFYSFFFFLFLLKILFLNLNWTEKKTSFIQRVGLEKKKKEMYNCERLWQKMDADFFFARMEVCVCCGLALRDVVVNCGTFFVRCLCGNGVWCSIEHFFKK